MTGEKDKGPLVRDWVGAKIPAQTRGGGGCWRSLKKSCACKAPPNRYTLPLPWQDAERVAVAVRVAEAVPERIDVPALAKVWENA